MITLQNFVFPERRICTEHNLYFRSHGSVGFSESRNELTMSAGSHVRFDTYFNLLNIGKWNKATSLETLFVELRGSGQMELRVVFGLPERSWEILYCETVNLEVGSPHLIDVSHYKELSLRGLIFLEVRVLSDGATFSGGRFATHYEFSELPTLAVTITTFKREQQVRETVERLQAFRDSFAYGNRVHVHVVDNGQSAEVQQSDGVTAMNNHNYGGAGGFARGLLEAENKGFSHCLFMDDDAAFHTENIVRAYMFMALSTDPRVAVAGAMINNTHKWAMWENGAFFDGSCHPLFCGTDLRDPGQVASMEFESAKVRPRTLYGGWWFFAFAVSQVKHHPFPFFVRGDDISFSLMNDFEICTLNGVVSFQDDFSEKESAQTLYLDLRNHLIHHLVSDDLERSALGTGKVAVRFIMRSLLRFHYESAAAQLLSWQDVMRGPEFFDHNIDMTERRAKIGSMMKVEVWKDVNADSLTEKRRVTLLSNRMRRWLGLLTLNGHLWPFSRQRWDRAVLHIGERGLVLPALGAAQITYLNTTGEKGYTVAQSKTAFFRLAWQMAKTMVQFLRQYNALKASYRRGYATLTTRDYWIEKLA